MAFVFFCCLALALTWPLVLSAPSAVEDRLDALLNTWILAWDGQQALTAPTRLFNANIFHPYADTLAYSEIILPQALIALPFTLATGNPVLGYNIALLASFALSGFAMYLLGARLTRSVWGGIAAGVVFTFNAYKMSNVAQAQLLALQWLPLALIYLDRTLSPRRQPDKRQARRDALLLAVFFVLQALSSFYYAMLSALALALAAGCIVIANRRRVSRSSVMRTVAALAAAGLFMLPFMLPYLRVASSLSFRRGIDESVPFSASLSQYAQALPNNLLYGGLAPQTPVVIGGYPLDALFPGIFTLAMAGLGLVAWIRRPRLWAFPLLLAVSAFVLSLGPVLMSAPGHPAGLPLAMPYRLLYELPGLQALRAPVRFAALVFLGLSLLAALGVAALTRRGRDGARRLLALGAAALLVAEVVTVPAANTAAVAVPPGVPEVYTWLARQPATVVLELPMIGEVEERGLLNQYYSTYHWQTTPDGYSGFIPPSHGQIVYEMQSFPSERSLRLLQGLGVRLLIVHQDLITDWPERQQRLASYSSDIAEVQQFGETIVYAVSDAPAGSAVIPALYLPSVAGVGSPYVASLILRRKGRTVR